MDQERATKKRKIRDSDSPEEQGNEPRTRQRPPKTSPYCYTPQPSTSSSEQHPPQQLQSSHGGFFARAQGVEIGGGSFEETHGHRNNVTIQFNIKGSREEKHDTQQQRQPTPQASTSSSSETSENISDRQEETILHVQSDQRSIPLVSITEYSPDNSNVIYERHLKLKKRGFPLWIPGPNMSLPMPYRRKGVDIGDVGIITPSGGFSFLFNICLPSDDPVNPPILPDGFSPIYPPIGPLDTRQYPEFGPCGYLASTYIERIHNDPPSLGLSFKTSAAEGAILTLPEGAIALDLQNVPRFEAYAAANIESWYRYANGPRGLQAKNGEIRLVIGCDKATSWGVAAVANLTQNKTHHLKYRPSENSDGRSTSVSSIPLYQWEYSGMAEARVGPHLREIEELKRNDDSDLAVEGKYWNQSLFLRTLNVTLNDEVFNVINEEVKLALIQQTHQFRNVGGSNNSARIPHNANSGSVSTSQQSGETSGSQRSSGSELSGPSVGNISDVAYASMMLKGRATISTSPSAPILHPADFLNKLLLQMAKGPNIRAVITQDRDWYSVITDTDKVMPDIVELAERVLAAHHIQEVDGIVYLEPKDHPATVNPYIENTSSIDRGGQSNIGSVSQESQSSPTGLFETYDQTLLKVDEKDHTNVKTILRWLCFAVRPMRLLEIAEIVSVHFDPENGPHYSPAHRESWDGQNVLKKYSGLIVESEDGTINLAHSVKEYLLSDHLRTSASSSFYLATTELSHSLISQTCLAYLMQFNAYDSVDSNTATSFPFAPYAAEHWIFHAKAGGINRLEPSWTLKLATKLFIHTGAIFRNWVRIWDLDKLSTTTQYYGQRSIAPPLYYAALAGLQQVCRLQLLKKVDVNARGGVYGTSLQAASHQGHTAVVKMLLENGADPNARGGEYSSALQAASIQGHKAVVMLLLEKGADPNAQGGTYGTALQAASYKGQQAIVKLLLEKGADPNTQGGENVNALQAASWQRHETIVKLLLEHGADPNAQGGEYSNVLQAVSWRGYEIIAKLLLQHGADPNAQGGEYGNALQAASWRGHVAIAKLLLEHGANPNAQGGEYGTALRAASWRGHREVVELLLEHGADPNARRGYRRYNNALYVASWQEHAGIAKLLLEHGADPNIQGGKYGNALQAASHEGDGAMVKLLLEHGADPNAQGGEYNNALNAALWQGHKGIVRLLLENGANPNTHSQRGKHDCALYVLSYQGHGAVVKLLLAKGVI